MGKKITWILIIIFSSVFAFAGWYVMENPEIILGESKRTYGKITDVYPSQEVKSYKRKIKYVYSVNNEFFYEYKKLGIRSEKQEIGNRVQLLYSVKNPKNNIVEKLINDKKDSLGDKYYSIKGQGYIELRLINGILKYKEYAEKGKIVDDFMGEYKIINDTLFFQHYNFEKEIPITNKLNLCVIDSNNIDQLIDINTNRIFKKIR